MQVPISTSSLLKSMVIRTSELKMNMMMKNSKGKIFKAIMRICQGIFQNVNTQKGFSLAMRSTTSSFDVEMIQE